MWEGLQLGGASEVLQTFFTQRKAFMDLHLMTLVQASFDVYSDDNTQQFYFKQRDQAKETAAIWLWQIVMTS